MSFTLYQKIDYPNKTTFEIFGIKISFSKKINKSNSKNVLFTIKNSSLEVLTCAEALYEKFSKPLGTIAPLNKELKCVKAFNATVLPFNNRGGGSS